MLRRSARTKTARAEVGKRKVFDELGLSVGNRPSPRRAKLGHLDQSLESGSVSSSAERRELDQDDCPATQPEVVDLGILSEDSDTETGSGEDEAAVVESSVTDSSSLGGEGAQDLARRAVKMVDLDSMGKMILANWAATKFQKVKFLNDKYFDPEWEKNVIVEAEGLVARDGVDYEDRSGIVKGFLLSKFKSLREYFVVKVREAVIECRKFLETCGLVQMLLGRRLF